ncbi:hypothetical protein [Halorussus marinus]|uniref:hypothetical protein n=1 Tax=Halorussus marinus TaxID=2505976 RepID=UPI00106E6725|nr:hypothetical protein [Halorussus marinus]
MNDTTQKYTTPNRWGRYNDRHETNYTAYTDYDPDAGPVYVIEAEDGADAWLQSTRPVDVEP